MKKLILLTTAAILALGAKAQTTATDGNDTLKIKWKNSRIWIFDAPQVIVSENGKTDTLSLKKEPSKPKKQDFVHWGGLDLGVSMLTTIDNKFILPAADDTADMNYFLDLNYSKSLHFSLNPVEKNFRLYKNYLMFTTGLGVEWNSYNFKKNITLSPDAATVSASTSTIYPDSIKFSRNKLKVTYAKVPVLFTLNTNNENPKRSFHFSGGIEVAYKLGSRTKQKYEINGSEVKSSRRDDYHLADFKYASVFRMGYGDNFTFFMNYGLSELFEGNKGSDDMDLFPLTAGISIDL